MGYRSLHCFQEDIFKRVVPVVQTANLDVTLCCQAIQVGYAEPFVEHHLESALS